MAKDHQISGAPIPMKIGNTTFRARTLTDKDFDELNAYVRWKFLEESRVTINQMAQTAESRQEMMTAAMLAASVVTFNSPQGSRIINLSVEGQSRVGWQMIHHNHPNVSPEEFEDMVRGDSKNGEANEHLFASLTAINEAFIELNIAKPEDNDSSEDKGDSDSDEKSDES